MTRFSRLPILVFMMTAALSGCGFQPMYGDHAAAAGHQAGPAALSNIAIDIIPDREGQILRNTLIDRLYQNGYPASPVASLKVNTLQETRTELDLTKSSEATRAQLRLRTTMTLTDLASGKVLLTRNLQTVTSYNILGSEFATRVTESNARDNAINDLARQIELNLSLYYNAKP